MYSLCIILQFDIRIHSPCPDKFDLCVQPFLLSITPTFEYTIGYELSGEELPERSEQTVEFAGDIDGIIIKDSVERSACNAFKRIGCNVTPEPLRFDSLNGIIFCCHAPGAES